MDIMHGDDTAARPRNQLLSVLLIEDDPLDAEFIRKALADPEGGPLEVKWETSLAGGLQRLGREDVDAVLLDLMLPDSQGLDTVARLRAHFARVPIVVLTGVEEKALAAQALWEGVQDDLDKGYVQVYRHVLKRSIRYAVERRRAEEALRHACAELKAQMHAQTTELAKTNEALRAELDERKLAEAALGHRERLYAELLRESPDSIVTLDRLGCVQTVNVEAERFSGYQAHELIGRHFTQMQMIQAASLPRALQEFTRILAGQQPDPFEVGIVTKQGARLIFEVNARPIRDGHDVTGVQVVFRDVTERTQAERLKEEFLEVLSHDFRTPITAIGEGVSLLGERRLAPPTPEQAEILATVRHEVARLATVLDKMALATDLISRRVRYALRVTEVGCLLRRLLAACGPLASAKGVTVRLHGPREPVTCVADADWLLEALRQITQNGIQATPDGGLVRLCWSASPEGAVIQILDTGSGIPAEELPQLFQRFRWTGGLHDRKTGGLGLGLFIAKSILDAHQGTITVDSAPGQGTRVSLLVPSRSSSLI
jgi:PAS domain S-box-containing protein